MDKKCEHELYWNGISVSDNPATYLSRKCEKCGEEFEYFLKKKEEPKPACDHVFCFTTADEFEVASETMSRLPYLRSWILENKTPYTEWFSNQVRSFSKGIMIESDSYLMCRFCPTCGEKIDWDEIEKKLNLKKDE